MRFDTSKEGNWETSTCRAQTSCEMSNLFVVIPASAILEVDQKHTF